MFASLIRAADEWSNGTLTLARMEAIMAASCNVHPF